MRKSLLPKVRVWGELGDFPSPMTIAQRRKGECVNVSCMIGVLNIYCVGSFSLGYVGERDTLDWVHKKHIRA